MNFQKNFFISLNIKTTTGVNFVKRNLAKRVTPVVTITKDGDYYVFKTETTVKNTEIKFKLNEEFEEMRADDVLVKVWFFFVPKKSIN